MSATYLVEVVNFDDLRPGDRVLYQGAPVTIATVGCNVVMPAIVEPSTSPATAWSGPSRR